MDSQLKRGILEICVLARLLRGEAHGYQIQRDLDETISLSESALYQILKRHETAGAVTAKSVEHQGRLRRVYELTDGGIAKLRDFGEQWREAASAFDYIERAVNEHDKE